MHSKHYDDLLCQAALVVCKQAEEEEGIKYEYGETESFTDLPDYIRYTQKDHISCELRKINPKDNRPI